MSNGEVAGQAPHAPTFEQAVDQLQTLIRKLESGELALEDSLKSFEEGVRLARSCQEMLSQAEKRVELLTGVGPSGEARLEPFSS